ncbi:hypothetical protein TTHERM_000310769 (macronuclear) [Tetrahymena thermophila SB210]|uniref:Uncharacterized protein n=1 Tax=Tetrahymena thermophila (strain SB210) TaxID=312017 RepID=W7XGC4_TETTS|nr:hypothetical protein TTHERM_000310769 [Tetrahymena thermophila SB210]EWS73161.1 hypothetical protein TTHERM_000310769 [Tetrahymena thermophila SB210]|eukprot:XP_012654348.1 hypothetical protein TTHERM_000310769 [Tetrahymena thermophila SB210]
MQKVQLNKQGKPQSFKKVQLGVLGKPLSGMNQMNLDYSDSKSFIAFYESQRRRDEDQFEKKNIFKVFDSYIKENSSKEEYFKQKSKQMKERTLKHNLYYIDQQIIQKELNEISLTNTRAEFDKKSSIQSDELLLNKQIQAAQFIQGFNEQSKGKTGAGENFQNQSQTFNRKEMHIIKLKNKNQSSKIDENQEYQQIQQCEQNQGLFQIKRKVTNFQVNSKSDIQTKQLQYERVKSPTQLNQSIVASMDIKILKNQKQVTFSSTPQQVISLKHSLSSLDVASTAQKFKQNSTHQKINTQIIHSQQEIVQDLPRKQSIYFANKLNQVINDLEKPFKEEQDLFLEPETNDCIVQNIENKQKKINQSESDYLQNQMVQQENQDSLIGIISPQQQNQNEQQREQEKMSKIKENSSQNDRTEIQKSSEIKNDQQIYLKHNFSHSQNQQNTTIQKSNINLLDQSQNAQQIQKKSSEQPQNQKKVYQKKQQRAEEKKTNIIKNSNKIQSNSSYRSVFLPNNFIIILEKGFSLFTYHFSEKFMQERILTFLTIQDCMSLRLVNKELYRRANKILFLRSQREQLIIEKKILKSTYRSQISDFIENQIQDFVQIIESFEDIQDSDYSEFMQMVIPPQNLLVVLHIFLCLFGKKIVGIESLLDNRAQWKRVMTVCFVKGCAKEQIKKIHQKANLEQLHELLPQKIYEHTREQISQNDSILSQLTSEKYPFQFKLFTFVEKILDLYEILCLKYPNVIKFIELLKQIKNDPEIRVLSFVDDNFCNKFELV